MPEDDGEETPVLPCGRKVWVKGKNVLRYIPLSKSAPDRFPAGALLVLGCFDGLHLGHRALLKDARDLADRKNFFLGVWSPAGAKTAKKLLSEDEKLAALQKSGVCFYAEEPFDAIKELSPEKFFYEYLMGNCGVRGLACGENFTFGKNREGNSRLLREFCAQEGVPLLVRETVRIDGETVSSAAIRQALFEGDAEKAKKFLGHAYGFFSHVEKGRQVGRTLGFPTLNLPIPEAGVQARGVYFAGVSAGGELLPAVVNIGVHPTFESAERELCEAHLLRTPSGGNFGEEGQKVYIEFYRFVRREEKFQDIEALKAQLEKDAALARSFFGVDLDGKNRGR